MNTAKGQNLALYGLVLLSLTVQTWGQSCLLDSVCSALGYPKQSKLLQCISTTLHGIALTLVPVIPHAMDRPIGSLTVVQREYGCV